MPRHLPSHGARLLLSAFVLVVFMATAWTWRADAQPVLGDSAVHTSFTAPSLALRGDAATVASVELVAVPEPAQASFSHASTMPNAAAGRVEYLGAIAARDAGDATGAAALFASAAARGGLVAPVAQLRQAQTLAGMNRRDEAQAIFSTVIAANALPDTLRPTALTEAASNLHALNRPADAIAVLALVDGVPGTSAVTRAEARWEIGRIRRDVGDSAWADDARAAILLSPDFVGASAAIDALVTARLEVPRLAAGMVYYRARRDADAIRLFNDALSVVSPRLSTSDAARAWFYIGAARERVGQTGEALSAYQRSIELAETGPLADDAMYGRASLFADVNDQANRVRELDRLASTFPASPFAAEARLVAAVETGLAGALTDAVGRLDAITRTQAGEEAADAARWRTVLGGIPGTPAATFDPASFAAILERSDVDAQQPLPAGAFQELPMPAPVSADVEAVTRWVAQTYRIDPAVTLEAERSLALGLELAAAGEDKVSRRLLSIAVAERAGHPTELLRLAREAGNAGLYDVQQQAAVTLLAPLNSEQRLTAPNAVLRFAYPAAYLPETLRSAQESGVPPLLLLALVRQESAFYPRAGSSVGAFGLAQLMPATADQVAKELSMPPPGSALGDPAISLRLGARYLGVQLRAFNGNVPAALSAYNAGPGNAKRWQTSYAPHNFDGLLWSTDFEETRRYMDHVLENYAWYRYIYTGSELSIR